MTYYIRNGTSYRVSDEGNVDITTILPVGNYIVKQDAFGNFFLDKVDNFIAPKKLYGDVLKNANRILNTYFDRTTSTGVMLAGEKGSGKTLLSKMISVIATEKDVPTILVNTPYHGDEFNQFIQGIDQPCIILLDEFEKMYDSEQQESILTLLDGVFPSKKLFILTCNDKWRIDQNMRNRPGRIYYMMDFKGLDISFIEEYCEDNLKNKEHISSVIKISTLFSEFNFDMLKALVEEMNRYNETAQESMAMLNAKPEFSDKGNYEVQLVINNSIVPDDDLYERCLTWSGNPVTNEVPITYKVFIGKANKKERDFEWETITFTPHDITDISATSGKFVFTNSVGVLTLTRVKTSNWDYFKAF